ncbi:YiiX/YebB-like N1pC/P60 family cysteine hydrolase [Pseudoxanthomonas suwonensis]|uniref:Lipo-like protein n=1 Tax=Pseudoxanthomonas suwonensis TaxID=314722 RepID=A0A0E3Z160_9GAMM|nr:YiiX/YebB-like N1pC/P60 family cysteine hydrolase [Pseudoxanthomonas suwonensis]AKC86427.1 lipo-like protein [Pseudoxanthomonas suwonensis]
MALGFIGKRMARFLAQPRERYQRGPSSRLELLAATLRRGDVLLVDGTSRFASAIKYLTQSTWSHAALCLGVPEGAAEPWFVDVDINDGVRTVPLAEFAGLHARICRPVGLSAGETDAVVEHMVSRVGHNYDLKNIVDLARYLVRQPPVPDPLKRRMIALGSGEPTRAICSTLLAEAFGVVRYPILPEIELQDATTAGGRQAAAEILHIRHHSLYTPRDFDVSPFFQVVKPRLEAGFDFRRLVWSDAQAGQGGTPL